MYTELGFSSGFKTLSGTGFNFGSPTQPLVHEEAKYWIRVNDSKGKELNLGDKSQGSTANFIIDGFAAIQFDIKSSWMTGMPDWLKKHCNTNSCTVNTAETFFLSHTAGEMYFNVGMYEKGQSFKIMVSNGSETKESGMISKNKLKKQEQKFEELFYKRNQTFWNQINAIRANLDSALSLLKKAKEAAKNLKAYWEGMIKTEEDKLKKLRDDKKKIEADIARLNTVITTKKNEVTDTMKQKRTCDEQQVNLLLAIQAETKALKAAQKVIDDNLAKAKKAREEAIKKLFYWLEASYFYRVFAERLVKNTKDLAAATLEATIAGTQAKIKSAFMPIKVNFATASAK
jgi:hypothetical protein